MGTSAWVTRRLAGQLGHPRGVAGRLLGAVLNRRNGSAVRAAVAALPVRSDAVRRLRREVDGGRLHLHRAPMEALPLPDGALDAAITLNTIYFLPDLATAFSELRRVLRPDGRVVVGLGDPEAMARMAVTGEGFLLRPVTEVVEALRAAGLVAGDHRRVGGGDDAFHLLLATPAQSG